MEQLLKDLNIIEDLSNETYIGKVESIIKMFLELIRYDIHTIENAEETMASIEEKMELIKDLQKDKELCKDTIIKISYNPMGCFRYEVV